jgi:hypothetical protein
MKARPRRYEPCTSTWACVLLIHALLCCCGGLQRNLALFAALNESKSHCECSQNLLAYDPFVLAAAATQPVLLRIRTA